MRASFEAFPLIQELAAQRILRDTVALPAQKPERKFHPTLSLFLGLSFLGLWFVIGPFFWTVDVGGRILSTTEAWEMGAAQIMTAMGAWLLVLTVFLRRGASWPRWAIVFWCPCHIVMGIGWSMITGIGEIDPIEIGLIGVPAMLFWAWGFWRHFFGPVPARSG
jgi:hypothetical protein